MAQIKTLVKIPEHPAHVEYIDDSLESMQKVIRGKIEAVTIEEGWCVICDDEGRLKGRAENCEIGGVEFVGKIMIAGTEGDGFKDFEITKEFTQKYPQLWEG